MSNRLCLFLILSIGVLFMGDQALSISLEPSSVPAPLHTPITVGHATVGATGSHLISSTTIWAHNQSQSLRRRGTGRREILAVPTYPESLVII